MPEELVRDGEHVEGCGGQLRIQLAVLGGKKRHTARVCLNETVADGKVFDAVLVSEVLELASRDG